MSDDDLIRRGDAVQAAHNNIDDPDLAIAALPAAQPVVKVKPLVWVKEDCWPDAYYAQSALGRYEVGRFEKSLYSCHVEPEMRDVGLTFRSPEEAMQAGAADYEARILAALDVQPAPDVAGLVGALRLAKRMIDEALPKFDWRNSFLDANAIRLLNEAPVAVETALAAWEARNG